MPRIKAVMSRIKAVMTRIKAVMSPIKAVMPPIQAVMKPVQALMKPVQALMKPVQAVIFGGHRRLMPVTPSFAGAKPAPSAQWEGCLGDPSQCSGKRKASSETERSSLAVKGFDHGPGGHARLLQTVTNGRFPTKAQRHEDSFSL